MSYTAFDTADVLTGHAHEILNAGYTAVGLYARSDRTPEVEIQGLQSVGIKIWSIWEQGNPTDPSFFDAAQGLHDAKLFLTWAYLVGQPQQTPVFACVDYDAQPADVAGYITQFHQTVKASGYLMGVYGSGHVCGYFKNAGYAHYTFLAQSQGWNGFQTWAPHADIRQASSGTVLGFGVDFDSVVNPAVLW